MMRLTRSQKVAFTFAGKNYILCICFMLYLGFLSPGEKRFKIIERGTF
jgi:hypothetical protein